MGVRRVLGIFSIVGLVALLVFAYGWGHAAALAFFGLLFWVYVDTVGNDSPDPRLRRRIINHGTDRAFARRVRHRFPLLDGTLRATRLEQASEGDVGRRTYLFHTSGEFNDVAMTGSGFACETGLDIGNLEIDSQELLDRAAAALGDRALRIEDAQFNKTFRVQADDPRLAVAFLHPAMIKFWRQRPTMSLQLEPGWALVLHSGSGENTIDFPTIRAWSHEFRELIPRHLVADHPYDPSS